MKHSEEIIRLERVKKYFSMGRGKWLKAVDGVNLSFYRGRPWGWWGSRVAARPLWGAL